MKRPNLFVLTLTFLLIFLSTSLLLAQSRKKPKLSNDPEIAAAQAISHLKEKGAITMIIVPESAGAVIAVEPQLWKIMFHKDKVTFVHMFISFFTSYNRKNPGPGEIQMVLFENMTTHKNLATGWVKQSSSNPAGKIKIYD